MFIHASSTLGAVALLAGLAAAKTDIGGCVSSQTVAYGGASLIWYVPDTGEICEFLDCGGGRAPPKTTVPGCPAYEGTATYSPSYLPGFGTVATSTSSAEAAATATESSVSEHSSASEHSSSSEHSSLSESASTSASERSTITSPPVTIVTGTATSSGSVRTQTGADSDVASSSFSSPSPSSSLAPATGGNSTGSSTSSVSVGGAALPTAAMKGAFGVMAGLAAGVALL